MHQHKEAPPTVKAFSFPLNDLNYRPPSLGDGIDALGIAPVVQWDAGRHDSAGAPLCYWQCPHPFHRVAAQPVPCAGSPADNPSVGHDELHSLRGHQLNRRGRCAEPAPIRRAGSAPPWPGAELSSGRRSLSVPPLWPQ